MWRYLRISLLLFVLLVVATQSLVDRYRSRDWTRPIWVGLYPLDADGSGITERYLENIKREDFAGISDFFAREGARHGLANDRLLYVELYPRPARLPPQLTHNPGRLEVLSWSLRMRWYAWRAPAGKGQPAPNIRLFVLFHDPQRLPRLPHSVGLNKGLMGVVHVFASREQQGSNQVVIAHELMHTFGAEDRYDPATNQPRFPDGYADPQLRPLLPQRRAEIMGGRIPVTAQESVIPASLEDVVVGPVTAREIAWTD